MFALRTLKLKLPELLKQSHLTIVIQFDYICCIRPNSEIQRQLIKYCLVTILDASPI